MKLLSGEILSNERYGDNLYKIEVFSPYICNNAQSGQFMNVKCSHDGSLDPFLRRPLAIFDIEKKFNVFSLLYLLKGKGTQFISRLEKGDILDFAGPMGKAGDVTSSGAN